MLNKIISTSQLNSALLCSRKEGVKVSSNHIIDCSAPPFVPDGWKVVKHDTTRERIHWNPRRVELYLTPSQKADAAAEARIVFAELNPLPVLNANILDYLLKRQELIPKEWRDEDREVFFWGTVYRDHQGFECVRSLIWSPRVQWNWETRWLDGEPLLDIDCAAVLKIRRH